jgi:hypothetical protein
MITVPNMGQLVRKDASQFVIRETTNQTLCHDHAAEPTFAKSKRI